MHVLRQMRARQRIVGLKADKEKVVATAEIKPELAHKREVTSPPPLKRRPFSSVSGSECRLSSLGSRPSVTS